MNNIDVGRRRRRRLPPHLRALPNNLGLNTFCYMYPRHTMQYNPPYTLSIEYAMYEPP